jgi:hypothetical protein
MPTTYDTPSAAALSERMLAFLRRGLISRGVPATSAAAATAKGTDRWLTVQAFVQGLQVVLANQVAREDAFLPDTATGDDLDRICAIYGLTRSTGAGAQGDVTVTTAGLVTYAAGQECVSSAGLRYRVVAATSANNGQAVAVVGIDVGDGTNLAAGETLTWTSPPFGSAPTCVVAAGGLVNGQNADDDDRLRERLFKLLREPQNGGSWAHYRQWAEDASAAVEAAYVYPAAQGPGTVHLAYTVEGTGATRYSRTGTSALTLLVASAVVAEQPEFADVTVTTVAHENLDLALKVTLPEPPAGGGTGGGWVDVAADRWAKAKIDAGNVDGVVRVTSVTNSTTFVTNAYNAPVDGSTILIFSAADRRALTAVVVGTATGAAGSWTFSIDRALPTVAATDRIMPACELGDTYAETLMAKVATLAPGEKTSDASVLPRAYRHPRSNEGFPSALTTVELVALQTAHPEMTVATYFALGTTVGVTLPLEPSLPATVTDPPNVWRVRHLAFYPT